MNIFFKKGIESSLLAVLLTIPTSYAGTLTLTDVNGTPITSLTIEGDANTQVELDSNNINTVIQQLINLGLDVNSITTLLINAGIDPVTVTQVFVTLQPSSVLTIVEAAAKATPDKAADVAATAATLLPDNAANIAGAVAKYITSKGQAHQIATKVGRAVNAIKINGEPSLEGYAIASAIIDNAPKFLPLTKKVLAHDATRGNEKNNDLQMDNPSTSTPPSPS